MPQSIKEDFKRNNIFSLYNLCGHKLVQDPCPRGHEIYNFSRPFIGHHNYIVTYFVCSIPGRREEDFKRNNAFSLNDLYGHTPAQEALPWGS